MNGHELLQKWRHRHGLTLADVARSLESSRRQVGRWEAGAAVPAVRPAVLLARVSGGAVPVESWVDGDGAGRP